MPFGFLERTVGGRGLAALDEAEFAVGVGDVFGWPTR
jgi:hypothetical protein